MKIIKYPKMLSDTRKTQNNEILEPELCFDTTKRYQSIAIQTRLYFYTIYDVIIICICAHFVRINNIVYGVQTYYIYIVYNIVGRRNHRAQCVRECRRRSSYRPRVINNRWVRPPTRFFCVFILSRCFRARPVTRYT